MKKQSVLIASPVHQKPEILEKFLFSLQGLEDGDLEFSFLFIDDNVDPTSKKLLQSFMYKSTRKIILIWEGSEEIYEKDETTHYWTNSLIEKVGQMKNEIIRIAIKLEADALFFVDSDLLLHPDTIINLFSSRKEIISNIFWTKWNMHSFSMPQVWFCDEYTFFTLDEEKVEHEGLRQALKSLIKLRKPGIYEVGGLGACTLIRREALLKGISFHYIRNLPFWGEDRHFCVRAAALGIPLYVDTRLPAFHIFRDSDMGAAEKYIQQVVKERKLPSQEFNQWLVEVFAEFNISNGAEEQENQNE